MLIWVIIIIMIINCYDCYDYSFLLFLVGADAHNPSGALAELTPDEVFPHFIVTELPTGLPGVAISGALAAVAVGETVILLHLPLPLVGVSIETMRGCQQNDSLVDG